MKKFGEFLISATTAGFVVLLPVFGIVLLFLEAFKKVKTLGDKLLAAESPAGASPLVVILLTLFFIALICFLTGWLIVPRTGSKKSTWLEEKVLNKIPGYLLFKGFITGALGIGTDDALRTALLERLPGIKELVLVIEKSPEGQFTVFVPTSSTLSDGSVLVVREEMLEFLDVRLKDFREILSFRGAGIKNLLKEQRVAGK